MKDNQHVQPVIAEDYSSVTFKTRGHADIVLDMTKVHPDLIRRAAAVGFAQVRIVDAAAVGMTDDEGNIIPEDERIEMKYERMAALVAHYMTGTSEWSRRGEGTGGGKSVTIEAIARIRGIDYDTAKAQVADYAKKKFGDDTKKCLAFLRQGERVAAAIAAIRAERAPKPKVDADKALSELA